MHIAASVSVAMAIVAELLSPSHIDDALFEPLNRLESIRRAQVLPRVDADGPN